MQYILFKFFLETAPKMFQFCGKTGRTWGRASSVSSGSIDVNKHENVWSDSVSSCTHSCSPSLSQLYRNSGHLSEIVLGCQVV